MTKGVKDMKNIVLIGMPGAGKSTIGIVLAKRVGFKFVDSDLVIQEKEGKLLHEIISEVGNDGFIEVENRINASLDCKESVIATGGSVIYGEDAMRHLKEIGTVIYLKLSYEEINKRLANLKDRGVVLKENQTLKDLYNERTVLYERYTDITFECDGKSIEQIVTDLSDLLTTLQN